MSYSVAVRRPVVTAVATGLAAIAAVLQYALPGGCQVAANLVTLPLVGAAVEVLLGCSTRHDGTKRRRRGTVFPRLGRACPQNPPSGTTETAGVSSSTMEY
jgi:peptidoglycan/LPS O-acetylase OafA/YrhL